MRAKTCRCKAFCMHCVSITKGDINDSFRIRHAPTNGLPQDRGGGWGWATHGNLAS